MKLTRRILCLLLSIVMLLGLMAGCGEKEANRAPTDQQTNTPAVLEELKDIYKMQTLPNRANGSISEKENTVLVYMVGSDLESQYGSASADLLEMISAGIDTSKTNLVIYTGGASAWQTGIPSECNNILCLSANGTGLEYYASTQSACNTGNPATLVNFLNYATENFPAKNYSLIFWDHGGGSLYGFGSDELFGYDGLSLQELELAMANSPFAKKKLAFVGFDACLMSTLETAVLFADYAEYMVASEETEPGCGWDYSSLKALNSGNAKAFADRVLSTYETSMKQLRYKPDYTLSCLDLSKLDAAVKALDQLFAVMRQDVIDGNYSRIAKAREAALSFGMSGIGSLSNSMDHVDLGNLALLLKTSTNHPEADAALTAVKATVVRQVSNMTGSTGLSIYFPYHNKSVFRSGGYNLYKKIPTTDGYLNFLEVYSDMWLDGTLDTQWTSDTPEVQPDFLALSLTQEELQNAGRVYYNVFRLNEDGETYTPISLENLIVADEEGTFLIPTDPEVCLLTSDMDPDGTYFQLTQTGENTYVSQLAVLMADASVLSGQILPVHISLKRNGSRLEITGIQERGETAAFYARQEVDPSLWNMLTFYTYPMIPTQNANGAVLPYEQWERQDSFSLVGCHYRDNFSLELTNLSTMEGEYYVQIVVEDTRGEMAISAWDLLRSNSPYTVETVDTEEGTMTFRVYEDHAKLVDYTGEETALEIPETVNGQPVTVLGESCLKNGNSVTQLTIPNTVTRLDNRALFGVSLEQLELPESLEYLGEFALAGYAGLTLELPASLKYIGYKCFSGAKMETITLPSGIEHVGFGVFYGCSNLTSIEISGNLRYTSVGGVLFSADKKTLVAYPTGADTAYTVPYGTETIMPSAFAGNYKLQSVTLPETLTCIDHFAFYGCDGIADLQLPESLEFIGQSAFGTDIGMPKGENTKSVIIGKNVSYIGNSAFSAFNLSEYIVDEENLFYLSVDGCLLNYGGTTLISVPTATEGSFEVPYGVCYLENKCLQDCDLITELILPDTVVAIALSAGVPTALQKLSVGAGLTLWENMDDFANVQEITVSEGNPNFTANGNEITQKP